MTYSPRETFIASRILQPHAAGPSAYILSSSPNRGVLPPSRLRLVERAAGPILALRHTHSRRWRYDGKSIAQPIATRKERRGPQRALTTHAWAQRTRGMPSADERGRRSE